VSVDLRRHELAALRVEPGVVNAPELTIPAGGTDAFTVTMTGGQTDAGAVQREILCVTNEWFHQPRVTIASLLVTPAE
jgi:hypothetical protein